MGIVNNEFIKFIDSVIEEHKLNFTKLRLTKSGKYYTYKVVNKGVKKLDDLTTFYGDALSYGIGRITKKELLKKAKGKKVPRKVMEAIHNS